MTTRLLLGNRMAGNRRAEAYFVFPILDRLLYPFDELFQYSDLVPLGWLMLNGVVILLDKPGVQGFLESFIPKVTGIREVKLGLELEILAAKSIETLPGVG